MGGVARPSAVLWDVGDVVVRWHPLTLYSKIFPDPAKRDRLLAEVCTMAWHVEHDRGLPFVEGAAQLTATHLRDVVISGVEGCEKPDPRIFEIACERTGLAPEQMLFIDDSAVNIEAAAALGFVVHRFDDPAALRPALERHGLL